MKTTLLKRTKIFLNLSLYTFGIGLSSFSYGQSFPATGVPKAINGTTTLNPSCTGSNTSISFTVSGVGVLSASNQLLEIGMRLRTPGSVGRLAVSVFLKAPDGTCAQIATKMGDVPTSTGTDKNLDYKFRSPQPCLNKYPDYEATNTPMRNFEAGVDSRSGVFATVNDISTAFNGVNANGTWTMYFGRTNSLYNTLPSAISAELIFGTPIPVSPADPNAGVSCVNAVVWDGGPLCATTAGKTSTSNRPSTAGCQWLSTSENNLWIEFTPTDPNVCINISGVNAVSGSATGVQSIIVSPTNPGTPCDNNWTVENCPRDDIYSSDVGSVMSSNHCFTGVPGQTYYLVVDGNAGAVTEVYITGIEGFPTPLAAELISFDYDCTDNGLELNWATATERYNDYFAIDYSEDGKEWLEIGRKEGMGSSHKTTSYTLSLNSRMVKGYYRLKQVDYDGKVNPLKTIVVNNCDNKKEFRVIPNPSKGVINLLDIKEYNVTAISVVDLVGNEIYTTSFNSEQRLATIDLSGLPKGAYLLISTSNSGKRIMNRIVIE